MFAVGCHVLVPVPYCATVLVAVLSLAGGLPAVALTAPLVLDPVLLVGVVHVAATFETLRLLLFRVGGLVSVTSDTCCMNHPSFHTQYLPILDTVQNTEDRQSFANRCINLFPGCRSRRYRLCQRTLLLPRTNAQGVSEAFQRHSTMRLLLTRNFIGLFDRVADKMGKYFRFIETFFLPAGIEGVTHEHCPFFKS